MESLNSIKEITGVSLLVFAPISINLYLQVIAFHCPQNNVELFHSLLTWCRHLNEYNHEGPSCIHAVHCLGEIRDH